MAKASFVQITAGLEELYLGTLKPGDRFIVPRIHPNKVLLSPLKSASVAARSYLPICKAAWAGFSGTVKDNWKAADFHTQQHGWRNYVQDKCKRIKLGLPGDAAPSTFHNGFVGKLLIESPAEEIKLIQPHPAAYYVNTKVKGTKNQYEPVFVEEGFGLPLVIGLSYKSDLISTGAGSFARLYASVRYLYQGQNLNYDLIVDLSLSHDWERKTATLSVVGGTPTSYNLYLHLYKVRGSLLFDHVEATHNASNWARDIFCQDIDRAFSRAFYQIPRHWAAVTVPNGAGFGSVYPN